MSYQSRHTGAAIDASVDTTQQILNMIYPVGSIYMSVNNVSPATFIGGTWTALTDRVLIGAGSSYAVNATGGATSHTHTSATHTHTSAAHTHTTAGHTLTVNEIPSHNHAELATFHQGNDTQSYSSGSIFNASARYSYTGGAAMQNALATANNNCTGDRGGSASHSHGDTGSTTPGATGSTTPGNTGSSSNLPPYLAVYMWKRTA